MRVGWVNEAKTEVLLFAVRLCLSSPGRSFSSSYARNHFGYASHSWLGRESLQTFAAGIYCGCRYKVENVWRFDICASKQKQLNIQWLKKKKHTHNSNKTLSLCFFCLVLSWLGAFLFSFVTIIELADVYHEMWRLFRSDWRVITLIQTLYWQQNRHTRTLLYLHNHTAYTPPHTTRDTSPFCGLFGLFWVCALRICGILVSNVGDESMSKKKNDELETYILYVVPMFQKLISKATFFFYLFNHFFL